MDEFAKLRSQVEGEADARVLRRALLEVLARAEADYTDDLCYQSRFGEEPSSSLTKWVDQDDVLSAVRTGLAPSQGHLDSSDFIGQPGLLLAHLTKVHGLDQGQVTGTLQQQADDATIFQHLADTHRSAQH